LFYKDVLIREVYFS